VNIDESMIPRRGRLLFRQYIPGKAHKYGIKMKKLVATNGYTWNYVIYTGEQESMAGVEHAQAVVMELLDGLDGCYGTDNFFTTISLAKYLLEHYEVIVLNREVKFLKKILVVEKFMDFTRKMALN
jgi:hypothetical protein